jgi:membrane-associated phospholipid phosphatase
MRVSSRPVALLVRSWRRHAWSLPLGIGAALSFARLGYEVGHGDLDAVDRVVRLAVDAWRGSLDGLMLGLTAVGDVSTMALVSVASVAALALRRRRREAAYVAVGAAGALVLNLGLKLVFHRARPDAQDLYLVPLPSSLSFPSGHTMGTTAVIGCLVVVLHVVRAAPLVRWTATLVGAAVVLGVALSRVYLGAHYPSDVLGGFLAAAAWVSALTGVVYPRLLPGEAAQP